MSRVDVAVVGSLNRDVVVRVPRHPRPGETVLGHGHFENPGGKGANQAVAAARLGASVAMVGRVGPDDAGRRLRAALTGAGVDDHAVRTVDTPTGVALITVADDGENTIVVSPGANAEVSAADVGAHAGLLEAAAVCLLQFEIPAAAVAAAARHAGGVVVVNPAPARPLDDALLAATTVLVPNRGELASLVGGPPARDLDAVAAQARDLARRGVAVVVTLGPDGAVVVDGARVTAVAAPAVEPVDTTAAGDAFCGALAGALAGGADVVDATRWAVPAGTCATRSHGAQRSLPTRAQVQALMA